MGHGTMYTITLIATCDEVKNTTELTFKLIQLMQSNAHVVSAEITKVTAEQETDFPDEPSELPSDWSFDGYDNYPGKPL